MYSLKTKIENVHSYNINKKDYAVNLNNGDSLINNNVVLPLIDRKKIRITQNYIVSYEKMKTLYTKDLSNNIVLEKNEFILPQLDEDNIFIARGQLNSKTFEIDYNGYYSLDNLKKNKEVKFEEKINQILLINSTCTIYKSSVNSISLLNSQGVLKWTLNIEQYLDSEISENNRFKYLAKVDNSLFLSCPRHTIICIDISSGEVLNKWMEIPGINKDSQIENLIPNSESFILDKEQFKLIGVFHKYYIEIDLKSSEINYDDISEELKKHSIIFIKQANGIDITKNHMYFTAMMEQNKNDSKFSYDCTISLNKETLKIDWIYKFEKSPLGTNKPKLSNNNLFQLDVDNTLYIFEKE